MIEDFRQREELAQGYFKLVERSRVQKRGFNDAERAWVKELESLDPDFVGELRQTSASQLARVAGTTDDREALLTLEQGKTPSGMLDWLAGGKEAEEQRRKEDPTTWAGIGAEMMNRLTGRGPLGMPGTDKDDVRRVIFEAVAKSTDNPALAEQAADILSATSDYQLRNARFLPLIGNLAEMSYEYDITPFERMSGDLTNLVGGFLIPGLGPAGSATRVAAGAGNVGLFTGSAGGDLTDVTTGSLSALAGGIIGAGIAPSSAAAIIGGEVAQLPVATLDAMARNPDIAAKIADGQDLTRTEEEILKAEALGVGLGASAGVVAGVVGKRAIQRAAKAEADSIAFRKQTADAAELAGTAELRAKAEAGDVSLDQMLQAKVDEALNKMAGAKELIGGGEADIRARALEAKRKTFGRDDIDLSPEEIESAREAFIQARPYAYVPDDNSLSYLRESMQAEPSPESFMRYVGALSTKQGNAIDRSIATLGESVDEATKGLIRKSVDKVRESFFGPKLDIPEAVPEVRAVVDTPESLKARGVDIEGAAVARAMEARAAQMPEGPARSQMIEAARVLRSRAVPPADLIEARPFSQALVAGIEDGTVSMEAVETVLGAGLDDYLRNLERVSGMKGREYADAKIAAQETVIGDKFQKLQGLEVDNVAARTELESAAAEVKKATREIAKLKRGIAGKSETVAKATEKWEASVDNFHKLVEARIGRKMEEAEKPLALILYGSKEDKALVRRAVQLESQQRKIERKMASKPGYENLTETLKTLSAAQREAASIGRLLRSVPPTDASAKAAFDRLSAIVASMPTGVDSPQSVSALRSALAQGDSKAVGKVANVVASEIKKTKNWVAKQRGALALRKDDFDEYLRIQRELDDLQADRENIGALMRSAKSEIDRFRLVDDEVEDELNVAIRADKKVQQGARDIETRTLEEEAEVNRRDALRATQRAAKEKLDATAARMEQMNDSIERSQKLLDEYRQGRMQTAIRTGFADKIGEVAKAMTPYDRGLALNAIKRSAKVQDALAEATLRERGAARYLMGEEYEESRREAQTMRELADGADEEYKSLRKQIRQMEQDARVDAPARGVTQAEAVRDVRKTAQYTGLVDRANEVDRVAQSARLQAEDAELKANAIKENVARNFVDLSDPNYTLSVRPKVVEELVNSEGLRPDQAEELVFNVERVALDSNLRDAMEILRVDPANVSLPTELVREALGRPALEATQGADNLRMIASLAADDTLLITTLDAAMRGSTRMADKFLGAVSKLLSMSFIGAASQDLRMLQHINSNAPDASAMAVVRNGLKQATESAVAIESALKGRLYRGVEDASGSFAKRTADHFRRITEGPQYSEAERVALSDPKYDMLNLLRLHDSEGAARAIAQADVDVNGKVTIADPKKTRLYAMSVNVPDTLEMIAPRLNAHGINTMRNYFPEQISPYMVDEIRLGPETKAANLIGAIGDQAAREALAETGDEAFAAARREQVVRGLWNIRNGDANAAPEVLFKMERTLSSTPRDMESVAGFVAESAATLERKLELPEFIYDQSGKAIPVLSRDVEGLMNNYVRNISRVLASRSILGTGIDGVPNRISLALRAIDSNNGPGKEAALSVYRQLATGKVDMPGHDAPYFADLNKLATLASRVPSMRIIGEALNSIAFMARPLIISGSLFTQMKSLARMGMDVGVVNTIASLWGKDRLRRMVTATMRNQIEGNEGMSKYVGRQVRAGLSADQLSEIKALDETTEAFFRNDVAQATRELETRQGAFVEGDQPAIRAPRVIGGIIGEFSLVGAANRWINNVASTSSITYLSQFPKLYARGTPAERAALRSELTDIFGIADVDRFLATGPTEIDYFTAARNTRARVNGVDVSILERPNLLRHWFTRKLFSLASVAIVQGSNYAVDIERARTLGATTPGMMDRNARILAILVTSGLYSEALDVAYERTQPTESPTMNLALAMASDMGYAGDSLQSLAYGQKLGQDYDSTILGVMFGGAATFTRTLEYPADISRNLADGDKSEWNKVVPAMNYISLISNAPNYGELYSDYGDKVMEEWQGFAKGSGLEDFVDAMNNAGSLLDSEERYRRVKQWDAEKMG